MLKIVIKALYKVVRSIIFSAALLVVGIYVLAYILLSIPPFTNHVKNTAATELSKITGGQIEIDNLDFLPFNEITLKGVRAYDPSGVKCVDVDEIGAGISLWKLISEGRVEITYGEILGLKANIVQMHKDAPLNIQFLIDAFAPKEKNREKKPFELALMNVVLRKSSATFRRPWIEEEYIGTLNLADLRITDLAADLAFPKLSDKEVEVDLRRLSFEVTSAIKVERIGLKGKFSPDGINVKNFLFQLPKSRIFIPEITFPLDPDGNIKERLSKENLALQIKESYITPSDFSFADPVLERFAQAIELETEINGNLESVTLNKFVLNNPEILQLSVTGMAEGLEDFNKSKCDISEFHLAVASNTIAGIAEGLRQIPADVKHLAENMGSLEMRGKFAASMNERRVNGNLNVSTDAFKIDMEGEFENPRKEEMKFEGEVNIENLKASQLFPKIPVGNINANLVAEGGIRARDPFGMISLVVENFELKGKKYEGFSINLEKDGEDIAGDIMVNNEIADIESNFKGELRESVKAAGLNMDIRRLNLSEVIDLKNYKDYIIAGNLTVNGKMEDETEFRGELVMEDFSFVAPGNERRLRLHQLVVNSERVDSINSLHLKSDWIDARLEGDYRLKEIPSRVKEMVASVFPSLLPYDNSKKNQYLSDFDFDIIIKKNNALPEFLNLPVRLLVPLNINGAMESTSNTLSLTVDVPYLQQGKDKLIYDSKIIANLDAGEGVLDALITTTLPVKKGDLALNVNLFGKKNALSTDLHWLNTENSDFKGFLNLDTEFLRNELTAKPEIKLEIKPSLLRMGSAEWNVSRSVLTYTDKRATVKGLRIWHDDQFVEIEGTASPEYADVVKVTLADIDVDYVFDLLQINYVTFGGTATGEVAGHALLSGDPVAETESFIIKDFSYNGSRLGTCLVTSKWNNEEKEIEMSADISHNGIRRVLGYGGIWLGRDSLCFDIEATKVPVEFVQPFMSVFSSHVGGFATGDVKLFGTFHDIDMTGKIFADSVAVKLDYTNTIYHGSDSVLLNPGKIEIPHFTLYDKNGHSALLTGELTHRYFHDPSFTFRLSDAENFLCYDTSDQLNPDWYGTLYGSGSAFLQGQPGIVNITADMSIVGNSTFTFVLNETQYARDYQFLTFSDKKKEAEKASHPSTLTVSDFKEMLKKRMTDNEGSLSRFGIDIRATVTPQALFTLVMDPAAGDKITARGRGALQVKYESDDDEMLMYGKYEIDEGNYNFSLQDIILRDFKIKEGSFISFNGDPLAADLDISATYRVNTNLSDLDKSFSTDRDLNRTNVPVDAVLSVEGNMTSPDITFDIELPTLTQDVERKVKSIISTDDMMNRQIIYLLALNRFYTPEYMGASGNGGELAAVASSTISSQLSNILGQLTDKVSVSPSFRSDKGDFSDIEVDVALSSRLLNNRLLINGNFGYRDRSNSSTTFVGDFDVEYLLSKNGNIRLKAYNHFNDQNYYLREALTTQGLGVVYRRDFDDWFTFLKRRKIKKPEESPESTDKIKTESDGAQD